MKVTKMKAKRMKNFVFIPIHWLASVYLFLVPSIMMRMTTARRWAVLKMIKLTMTILFIVIGKDFFQRKSCWCPWRVCWSPSHFTRPFPSWARQISVIIKSITSLLISSVTYSCSRRVSWDRLGLCAWSAVFCCIIPSWPLSFGFWLWVALFCGGFIWQIVASRHHHQRDCQPQMSTTLKPKWIT